MAIFRGSFLFSRALFCILGAKSPGAPRGIFSLVQIPSGNVLGTKFSVHLCVQITRLMRPRYLFVQIIYTWRDSRAAQFDFNDHTAQPENPWLNGVMTHALPLSAKPHPVRTCSRFHSVQTSFRRQVLRGDLFREHGSTMFQLELF